MDEEVSSAPEQEQTTHSFLDKIKENGLVISYKATLGKSPLHTAELQYADGTRADVVDSEGVKQPASCQYTASDNEDPEEVKELLLDELEELCTGKEICPSDADEEAPAEEVSDVAPADPWEGAELQTKEEFLAETDTTSPDAAEQATDTPADNDEQASSEDAPIDEVAAEQEQKDISDMQTTKPVEGAEEGIPGMVAVVDSSPIGYHFEKLDVLVPTEKKEEENKKDEKKADSDKIPRSIVTMFTYISFALVLFAIVFLFIGTVVNLASRATPVVAVMAGMAGTCAFFAIIILAVFGILSLAGKIEKKEDKEDK